MFRSLFKKNLTKTLSIWYFILAFTWLINFTYLSLRAIPGSQFSLLKQMAVYPLFLSIVIIVWKSKTFLEERRLKSPPTLFKNIGLSIFLISAIALFAELMIIRIHSIYFPVFAFYKNISLLSCFLGLGIGFARFKNKYIKTGIILPLFALQIAFIDSVSNSPLGLTLLNPIPEYFSMGIGGIATLDSAVSIYIFLSLIFVFNAICFVPLGQVAARFMEKGNKLTSYSWNLIGSLVGILAFSALSFFWTPPFVWIVIFALCLAVIIRKNPSDLIILLLSLGFVLLFVKQTSIHQTDIYSPYQNLKLEFK